MTTLGRNELCWCGSGKKYKRCHLDSEKEQRRDREYAAIEGALTLDAVAIRFGEVAQGLPDFGERVTAPANELNHRFRERIGDGLDGREAAEALEAYLHEIETVIAEIAPRHGRAWWLYTTRRLEPSPLGDSSPWTVMLYRRVLTLAILKHGATSEPEGEAFAPLEIPGAGRSMLPASLAKEDVVTVHAFEHLAYEYNHAASAFRRVGKGGCVAVHCGRFQHPGF